MQLILESLDGADYLWQAAIWLVEHCSFEPTAENDLVLMCSTEKTVPGGDGDTGCAGGHPPIAGGVAQQPGGLPPPRPKPPMLQESVHND